MSENEIKPVAWVASLRGAFSYCAETGRISRLYGQFKGLADTATCKGYRIVHFNGKSLKAHRVAWTLWYGSLPPTQIDHINGIRDDNRINNLRDGQYINFCNKRARSNRLYPKGVWRANNGRFRAGIAVGGKTQNLGYFTNLDEAAHAYNKAAICLHGEGACLNPIGVWNEM